jgi:histidinol-phosphatase
MSAGADLVRELAFASELADLAASISLPMATSEVGHRTKADRTPVTDVDIAVEQAMRDAVEAAFPDDGFLGEEVGRTRRAARTWVVDPIDGTQNLLDGLQLWTTLIALTIDDAPVLGVVDVPALGERYVAGRGTGATLNGEPIHVSGDATLHEAFVLHSGVEEWLGDERWAGFSDVASTSRRTRGISDAWGHMLVARGSADAMLEHDPCAPWDWAAASVILAEAGGQLTTIGGGALFDGCDLLSSNGALHAELVTMLANGRRASGSDRVASR